MYAIIEDGGRQFKVSEGDLLRIDLIDVDDETKTVEFNRVLLLADGENITVGTPVVEGAKVAAEITNERVAGKKVYTLKFKRRKRHRRRQGHRQKYTEVCITKIVA